MELTLRRHETYLTHILFSHAKRKKCNSSIRFRVELSLDELLSSLPVQVDERVDEVGQTSTDVEVEDDLVVEVEVEETSPLFTQVEPTNNIITGNSYLILGRVAVTSNMESTYSIVKRKQKEVMRM